MNINEIVKSVTDNIESFNNKENKTWGEILEKELGKLKKLNSSEKNIVLIRVVKEITRHGYSIEDNPFRLIKF